jgi:hypothetical protein
VAKLIGPLHSTEARGVFGAAIFNTWRGIRYAKRMTSPSQPRTSRVLTIRGTMLRFVRAWAGLGSTVITGWNTFATNNPVIDWTGVSKRLTGANWYVALNTRLIDMGKSAITNPPVTGAPATPTGG